jgi:hypothetical protein
MFKTFESLLSGHASYITAYLNLTPDLYNKLGLWWLQLLQKYLKVTNLFINWSKFR